MAQSRKTRRDRGHRTPADELTMRFLMRLWALDTLAVIGDELHLVRVGDPADVLQVPLRLLDELEFERGWIHPPGEEGERVRLTYAGKCELAAWMRRRHPDKRAVVNLQGERLELGK